MKCYSLDDLICDMRQVSAKADNPVEIVRRLQAPARQLALVRDWLEPRFFQCDGAQGFGIYPLHEEADHTFSVVVASLLSGRAIPPHNHRTWALQVGIKGYATNISWRRLDDGSRSGHAEIQEIQRTVFGPGEIVAFMPDDIHSIINESEQLALSLNLYGLSYAYTHASKFDPVTQTEAPLIAAPPERT
jgi:predicted metal-dependent enzyme (double-stranded beta helix superfamily)